MKERIVTVKRKTKETDISLSLNLSLTDQISIETETPFLGHLLHAMTFHGGFNLILKASGDTNVDPHHLVEDTGLVLGEAFNKIITTYGPVKRFGHSIIPMDDALSEVVIDACNRPFLVYTADFPQEHVGNFNIALLKEFFHAFSNKSGVTLHALCRYGENSHHMAEALFKAFGKALFSAFTLNEKITPLSTKGYIV